MFRKPVRRGAHIHGRASLVAWETLEARTLLSAAAVVIPQVLIDASAHTDGTTTVPASALTPAQIRTAYGVNNTHCPT